MPDFLFGLINSESITLSEIALSIVPLHKDIFLSSIERRCSRFLNNPNFFIHDIFDSIIIDVLSRFKISHPDINRFFVSFDHMFVEEKHTILMFSLRIGKQGIPIWFRCFENHLPPESCSEDLIIQGINYCLSLLSGFDIIFLADRWFNSTHIMKTIHDAVFSFIILKIDQNR